MRIQKTLSLVAIAGAMHSWEAPAQDSSSTTTNQELFRVVFAASGQAFDSAKGRLVPTRITERSIIAQALGTSASDRVRKRDYALVYNATQDSLQVVNANGEPVVDVVHFDGGSATGDNRQTARFTFMFAPGQTNEFGMETNAFGTAVITERASKRNNSAAGGRGNISGKLQFMLSGGTVLGTTTALAATGTTNSLTGSTAQICIGVFSTSGRFPAANTSTGAGPTTVIIINNNLGSGFITNNTLFTTNAGLVPTTGMVPTLTGNGSLPDLGVAIGSGSTPLPPFSPR